MEDVIQLYDDNLFEEIKGKRDIPNHEQENFKKSTTIGDVILIQFIICLLIIIAIATLNIFKPELTNNLLFEFKQNLDKPFDYKKEFSDVITNIVGYFNDKL